MAPTFARYFSGEAMSSPSTVPVPPVGVINPRSMRIVVVFPEPFGPTNPHTEPSGTSNVA